MLVILCVNLRGAWLLFDIAFGLGWRFLGSTPPRLFAPFFMLFLNHVVKLSDDPSQGVGYPFSSSDRTEDKGRALCEGRPTYGQVVS